MRTAPSVRRKLYFVSPLLTALLFGVYERLGLRRIKDGVGRADPPAPLLQDHARQSAEQIARCGLDKLEVLSGPFKGMTYGDFSYNSALIPEAARHLRGGPARVGRRGGCRRLRRDDQHRLRRRLLRRRLRPCRSGGRGRGGRHLQHGTGHAVQARGAERAAGSRPRRRRAHAGRAREPAAPLQAAAAVHRHRRRGGRAARHPSRAIDRVGRHDRRDARRLQFRRRPGD